jgi:hypothetical protein
MKPEIELYANDQTLRKVDDGMALAGIVSNQRLAAIRQMQEQGILFRESRYKPRASWFRRYILRDEWFSASILASIISFGVASFTGAHQAFAQHWWEGGILCIIIACTFYVKGDKR